MIELNKNNIDEFVSEGICLIEAGGELCPNCQELKPKLEAIEHKYPNIKFGYIDVQKNKSVAVKYKIMGIPVVMILSNGECVKRYIQAQCNIKVIEKELSNYQ